jgi:hypothetical protein
MAYIQYLPEDDQSPEEQVPDRDNILQIHGIHGAVMRAHYDLYRPLMYGKGPLSRIQREMIGYAVSVRNGCHY